MTARFSVSLIFSLPSSALFFLSAFLLRFHQNMMSFCKKSVHSFLGFTTSVPSSLDPSTPGDSNIPLKCNHQYHNFVSSSIPGGLSLVTETGGKQRPPNILESSSVKPSPASSPGKDTGGIRFLDDISGGADGLASCTESLGFESSDERRLDDDTEEMYSLSNNDNQNYNCNDNSLSRSGMESRASRWRKVGFDKSVARSFPPPISSLNRNGQPSFFLRPVRKDGRLELTEVRIHRPEILQASREDGRLRLHLIRDESAHYLLEGEGEEEDEEEEQEQEKEETEKVAEEEGKEDKDGVVSSGAEEIRSSEEKEEEKVGDWKFPVNGEGLRRCNELGNSHGHHHHRHHYHRHRHHLHVWSLTQTCVTTR